MFKLLLGAIIGSLVTYNVILPNETYKSAFISFNNYTMAKVAALLEDVKEAEEEKI